MKFNLTLEEKQEIIKGYGSSVTCIDTSIKVLNALDVVDDKEEFLELIASIALEVETMKDMKGSTLRRKSLSEVIAATIAFKYADIEEISQEKNQKVKRFLNDEQFENQ